jgi:hypothetical protein
MLSAQSSTTVRASDMRGVGLGLKITEQHVGFASKTRATGTSTAQCIQLKLMAASEQLTES